MGHAPTAEGVAVTYLDTLVGVGVATTLPAFASWSVITGTVRGFVVVDGVVGSGGQRGTAGKDTPLRVPVLSVSTWAAVQDSDKPQWGAANALAEDIVAGVWTDSARPLLVRQAAAYDQAYVQDMVMPGEPRRITDPDTGRAHYVMEIQLAWVRIPA